MGDNKSTMVKEWDELPSYGGLVDAVKKSYTSRKKNRNELPIVCYFSHYNNCVAGGWLLSVLPNKSVLFSLLSFFFYGENRSEIFLVASCDNNTNFDTDGTPPAAETKDLSQVLDYSKHVCI